MVSIKSIIQYNNNKKLCVRDHPYIMSAEDRVGGSKKPASFADVQCFIYGDIVGGTEKSKIMLT